MNSQIVVTEDLSVNGHVQKYFLTENVQKPKKKIVFKHNFTNSTNNIYLLLIVKYFLLSFKLKK